MRTASRPLLLFLLAVPAAHAHVVPPEQFHPVVESYRRVAFLVNLNPVQWDAVQADTRRIAAGLEMVSKERADAYRKAVADAIAEPTAPVNEGGDPLGLDVRREAARTVFELSTRAVAELLTQELEELKASTGDRKKAAECLEHSRQYWAAFEHEVRFTDPPMFREIGLCWLKMATALGSAPLLGQGEIPVDAQTIQEESDEILGYVNACYRDYRAPQDRPLAPVPVASGSYDALATVPPKLPPGSNVNKQLPRPRQILNLAARGVDETDTPLVALGDMAFDSPEIFGEPARSLGMSCNTCHNKGVTNPRFFIPGLSVRPGGLDVSSSFFAPHAANGHFDPVDIPDLRGIRFTGPYGRNGRFASLREFTRNVIVNEFNGPEPEAMLLDGLVAYMLEFDFLPNAALAPDGKLTDAAAPAARRGEEIFHRPFAAMGGRSCASCHVPGDHFLDRRRHDVGTVGGAEAGSRDRALDTPTLLSAAFTAPYFHDGSAPTLRAVSGHFNDFYGLGLSGPELDDLTAYVETVGGGIDGYEDTVFTLASELEEFSFFLSTYELLKARGENELLDVTFKTIAFEVQAHKWDVQDEGRLPVLDRLTEIMVEAYEARRRGDLAAVDARVAEYRALYEDHAEVLQ